MKQQKLRKYIKVVINEIFDEASRSAIKKGDADKRKDGKSSKIDSIKTKDKFGRNITKYTAVSKKGRETDMIQYDDPDPEVKKDDECILKDFDWSSIKIKGYHYEEGIKTDVIVYNNALIVQYKKENTSYSIPIKSIQKPDKTEEDDQVVITSTSRSEKIATCGDTFIKKTCHIYSPLSIKVKLLEKWDNRDTTKTKDCDNVYDKSDQERFRIDKAKKDKEKKSIFKGDTKLNLNTKPDPLKIGKFNKNL